MAFVGTTAKVASGRFLGNHPNKVWPNHQPRHFGTPPSRVGTRSIGPEIEWSDGPQGSIAFLGLVWETP